MTLHWNLDKAGMLCSGHLSAVCNFSWNHKTNGLKTYKKPNYREKFMAGTFLGSALKVLSQKNLYRVDDKTKYVLQLLKVYK